MVDLVTPSTPIKGNALLLSFGGSNYWADITSCLMDNEDADNDTVTFFDAKNGGGRQFFFTLTALQSLAAGSFWRYVWDNPGLNVPFVFAPFGNSAASVTQPQFTGTLTLPPKPAVGGAADVKKKYTFDVRCDIDGTPVTKTV